MGCVISTLGGHTEAGDGSKSGDIGRGIADNGVLG